jgi:hypothetical protein
MFYEEIKYFRSLVENVLISNYRFSSKEAVDIIEKSTFKEMLEDEPLFVTHYSPEHWGKDIVEEYRISN